MGRGKDCGIKNTYIRASLNEISMLQEAADLLWNNEHNVS
jgi:hypothetical protein